MKLRYCCNLTTTPDFSEITNLEELDLEGCVNLVTVHPSIGMLKRLVNQVPESLIFGSRVVLQSEVSYEPTTSPKIMFHSQLAWKLTQLSHLDYLYVNGCKKLEVLPELPHSLETVKARSCTSLCSITGLNPIMSKRSTYLSNCPKLFKNHAIESQAWISDTECLDSSVTSQGSTNRFSSFLGYLRIQNNRHGFFRLPGSSIENMDMIYRGNSIPNWFTNKSMGNHVKVELPLDWSFSKLRGYGICVVFKIKSRRPCLGYSVENFDGAYLGQCHPYYCGEYFCGKPIRIDDSDMIWLHYTTKEIQKLKKAENFVRFCFDEDEDFEVKECGVRIVCDEDLDEDVDLSMFEDFPTLSQHGGALCLFRGSRTDWSW
ncbi:NB-ARC domains-containing protein [Tanacetum coccineum]